MPDLSGIYDSYYIQPVARIKENLSIWTVGKWEHYIIDYQEPISAGPASTVDMVAQPPAATVLAGLGVRAKSVVAVLQVNDLEFLHARWEPIDNVEGLIWEQAGQQKNASTRIHSRVNRLTRNRDPALATTTFFVLGQNRDMNLEVRNPLNYPTPTARFIFWGNRMILSPWDFTGLDVATKALLAKGDRETIRRIIGTTTYIPAEGRAG